MCQLTFANLKDDLLNRQFFILTSNIGSTVHKHGTGFIGENCSSWKGAASANLITNLGDLLKETSGPVFGHIRLASANVPILNRNAHPFVIDGVYQFHNGTLKPKDSTKFVTTETLKYKSEKGTEITEVVNRSDSLVFFEHVMKIYTEGGKKDFPKALQDAMKDFTGKFAFLYYLPETDEMYVVRGKTADLFILFTYETDGENAPVTGYAINTAKDVLENSMLILSNLRQAQGLPIIEHSNAVLIEEESIFRVKEYSLERVGSIVENVYVTPTSSKKSFLGQDDDDYTWMHGRGGSTTASVKPPSQTTDSCAPADVVQYMSEVYNFMVDFCMSLYEMQALFSQCYNMSFIEAEPEILKHFTKKILANLRSSVSKSLRKRVHALSAGGKFPVKYYYDKTSPIEFPWMVNDRNTINSLLIRMEADRKASRHLH